MLKQQLIIEGKPFKNIEINEGFIEKVNLLPIVNIVVANTHIGISKPYYSRIRKDKAFIGFVTKDGQTYARTFFLSRSQGNYRILIGYKTKLKDGEIKPRWHDKGWGEESITLPFAIQKELSKLATVEADLEEIEGEIFYGLAECTDVNNQFKKFVDKDPIYLNSAIQTSSTDKIDPRKLIILDDAKLPNFQKIINHWKSENKLIKNVEVYTYLSKDTSLEYAFATDKKFFSWLIGVQITNGEITKFGVNKSWIKSGDFATPPFEYLTVVGDKKIDQTGGYGNEKIRVGQYVDMYTNYISKIKVVQEFNKSLELNIKPLS